MNKPELTAEKFISNPFETKEEKLKNKNTRLYKTGDLVRWLPDGNLDYIGRNDSQTKINGYRVELGEIESSLLSYPGIKQCVVINKEHVDGAGNSTGSGKLIAYYVKGSSSLDGEVNSFIDQWVALYDAEYAELDPHNYKFNIKGWNSSYTGKAIAQEDMREWVNNTIDRISTLDPKVILEMGSGSGLILFNIIESCDYYYATDFSKNVINHTQNLIHKLGYSKKSIVLTLCCRQCTL